VFFLYFTAVLPEAVLTAVSFKVQMLSISLATAGLRALHINASHAGAYINLSGLTVEVGSACSGFRLVVSMLAVAAFFAYIRQGPKWGKVALVVGALPLSIVANSLRIMLVSLVGREWGTTALRTAHDVTGYVLLLLTVGLLLIFARIVGCAKYKQMPSA
jgi:exosortase